MIKKIETMFPMCVFLAKDTNYKELTGRFKLYSPSTDEPVTLEEEAFNKLYFAKEITASVSLAVEKGAKNVGYIVVLNAKRADIGTCAHEATHICKHMEDYFDLESSANEYRAYITEWYTNQIYKFWKE